MYHYLEQNKGKIAANKTKYLFNDALNCSSGCICGTGCEPEKSGNDDVLEALLEIREASKKNGAGSAWAKKLSPEKRRTALRFRRISKM